ncbi:hypothetical protein DFH29DRAFT_947302, partial [Suillus ampliporus]
MCFLVKVAYFSAPSKVLTFFVCAAKEIEWCQYGEIDATVVTVAALFFNEVFRSVAERVLSVFIALSVIGV